MLFFLSRELCAFLGLCEGTRLTAADVGERVNARIQSLQRFCDPFSLKESRVLFENGLLRKEHLVSLPASV